MKKQLILIFSLLIFSLNSKAQDETKFYKILFAYADSLSKTGQKGIVSKEIYGIIENLDKNHPSGFFEKSGELINEGKFNEASLVFYIGYFRYRYFNLANPDYKPSEDGALLSSLKSIMQEPINLFLRTDIDNFIKILENCKEWLTKNDYSYFSKNKSVSFVSASSYFTV